MTSQPDPPAPPDPAAPPADPVADKPIDAFAIPASPALVTLAGLVWRLLVVAAGALVVLYLLGLAVPVVMAFFFALIVTALAGPVVRLADRVMPHTLAVVLTLIGFVAVAFAIFGFIVRSIVDQWPSLIKALEEGFAQIEDWARTGPLHWTDAQIQQALSKAGGWLTSQITSLLGSLTGVFTFVTAASVFAFAAFFFLADGHKLWKWTLTWVPSQARHATDDVGVLGWQTLSGYTRGIILVALCDGLLVFFGLELLGIPLAPVLAVVVAFGALIPVIGAPIATLLAAVVALATEGPVKALLVVGLTVLVGSFDGDILQPIIMGRAVSLHPLAIVTLIAVGGMAFGIVGALVAVPVGATAYVVAKYLTGRTPPPGTPVPAPAPGEPWHDGRHHWWQRWHRGAGIDPAAPPG